MPWTGPSFGFQRCLRDNLVGLLIDAVHAYEVGSEVIDEEILLCWIKDGFVGMGRVLTVRDCAGGGKSVCEDLVGCDVTGRGHVVGLEGTSGAADRGKEISLVIISIMEAIQREDFWESKRGCFWGSPCEQFEQLGKQCRILESRVCILMRNSKSRA